MTEVLTQTLPIGHLRLIPEVRYRVVSAFSDSDQIAHPVGESWYFEGFSRPRMFPGYTIHTRNHDGIKMQFRLRWGSDAISSFERCVTGPVTRSSDLLRSLSDEGMAAFARVQRYLDPLPEFSDALLDRIEENIRQASIYAMKADVAESHAEQSTHDLARVAEELQMALRNYEA